MLGAGGFGSLDLRPESSQPNQRGSPSEVRQTLCQRYPLTVGDVLEYLAGGMSEDDLLGDFPQITREDIRACLAYAAAREQRTLAISAN